MFVSKMRGGENIGESIVIAPVVLAFFLEIDIFASAAGVLFEF
jgi:hypothetical protein